MGKSQIYFTTNGGSSWSQMGNISGANSKFIAIAIAPSDPQTLYAATVLIKNSPSPVHETAHVLLFA